MIIPIAAIDGVIGLINLLDRRLLPAPPSNRSSPWPPSRLSSPSPPLPDPPVPLAPAPPNSRCPALRSKPYKKSLSVFSSPISYLSPSLPFSVVARRADHGIIAEASRPAKTVSEPRGEMTSSFEPSAASFASMRSPSASKRLIDQIVTAPCAINCRSRPGQRSYYQCQTHGWSQSFRHCRRTNLGHWACDSHGNAVCIAVVPTPVFDAPSAFSTLSGRRMKCTSAAKSAKIVLF